jgi:hypothetical protein
MRAGRYLWVGLHNEAIAHWDDDQPQCSRGDRMATVERGSDQAARPVAISDGVACRVDAGGGEDKHVDAPDPVGAQCFEHPSRGRTAAAAALADHHYRSTALPPDDDSRHGRASHRRRRVRAQCRDEHSRHRDREPHSSQALSSAHQRERDAHHRGGDVHRSQPPEWRSSRHSGHTCDPGERQIGRSMEQCREAPTCDTGR